MTADTTFSETNHRIQQVMLSLQRLSQRVLPDMKRAMDDMRSGDSPFAAASHEALLLETHRVIGAALKELGSIAKSHRQTDDQRLSFDVDLEILQFCARVDLDKLQLVSKAKKTLVDEVCDRLALHKIYLVCVLHEDSACTVLFHIQRHYSATGTTIRDTLMSDQDNDQMGQVTLRMNPFQQMRNAFVGAVCFERLEREESTVTQFKALFSEFLRTQKGALKVGRVRLAERCSEQWFNYLFAFATEEVHAECLVLDACSLHMDSLFSAEEVRRRVKRITIKAKWTQSSLGVEQISALACLAMNSGDICRIDIILNRLIFSPCLEKWIQAVTSCESSTRTVDYVLFHCRDDASMPPRVREPNARLPKRKWSNVNYRGETCEMEDIDEKAFFVFENPNVSKKITAVFARYSRHIAGFVPEACVTCNFIFNASDTSDIGDFSEMHIKTNGACSYGV